MWCTCCQRERAIISWLHQECSMGAIMEEATNKCKFSHRFKCLLTIQLQLTVVDTSIISMHRRVTFGAYTMSSSPIGWLSLCHLKLMDRLVHRNSNKSKDNTVSWTEQTHVLVCQTTNYGEPTSLRNVRLTHIYEGSYLVDHGIDFWRSVLESGTRWPPWNCIGRPNNTSETSKVCTSYFIIM